MSLTTTGMVSTFSYAGKFNEPLDWDTSKVTTLASPFFQAMAFNQPIGGWDTSQVTSLQGTLNNALDFDQDVYAWDVAKVASFSDTFTDTALAAND